MSVDKKSEILTDMGTANRDASQITKRNRGVALYAYSLGFQSGTNTVNPSAALTAPAVTSAEVLGQIYVGGSAATAYNNSLLTPNPDPNRPYYPFNPSSGGAGRSY